MDTKEMRAERLRRLMAERGEGVTDLHAAVLREGRFITQPTIRRILAGSHNPQRRPLEAIAAHYGVSVKDFSPVQEVEVLHEEGHQG